MSAFSAEVTDMAVEVESEFGDQFTLIPMQKAPDPNAPEIEDPSRVQVTFTGVFHSPQVEPTIVHSYDVRTDKRPGVQSGHPRVDIMPTQLALGVVVKVPDILMDVLTGVRWRVSSIFPTKTGICRCYVSLVG